MCTWCLFFVVVFSSMCGFLFCCCLFVCLFVCFARDVRQILPPLLLWLEPETFWIRVRRSTSELWPLLYVPLVVYPQAQAAQWCAWQKNKTKQLVVTFRWKTSVKCPFSPQGCYLSNLCVSQRWKGSVDKGVWKWGFTCLIHCSWSKAVSQVLFWGR